MPSPKTMVNKRILSFMFKYLHTPVFNSYNIIAKTYFTRPKLTKFITFCNTISSIYMFYLNKSIKKRKNTCFLKQFRYNWRCTIRKGVL